MGIYNSIKKRADWFINVSFDKQSGFYRYKRFDKYIYIRHPRHFLSKSMQSWLCENIFFKHYLPSDSDTVVDLGAGYGEEAVYLSEKSPNVRYIGVEPQPVIYECISNTFKDAGQHFFTSPYVITNREWVKFISQFSYASVGELTQGYIEVPTIKWDTFLDRYNIENIDLLKMNIEGAEKEVLDQITDFNLIKRFIISCHDFRANGGEGEQYRTKEYVTKTLYDNGYSVKTFNLGINWADDWIYAEK